MVIDQRSDLAARCAGNEHVADTQCAALDKHGRERAPALGERIRAEDGVTQAVEVLQRRLHIMT